jgi:hypothetical protein
VPLINTDGLVLIGPGSEWFWTMLSGLVLALTFLAIYRQLRAQRAAAIFEQFNTLMAQWQSRSSRYARLYALIDLRHRLPSDGMPATAMVVVAWFETLGTLVHRGHVDSRTVAATFSEPILDWWSMSQPFIDQDRIKYGTQAHGEEFEALAQRMAIIWKRTYGLPYQWNEAAIDELIDGLTAALARDREIEQGIIPERRPVEAANVVVDSQASAAK